MGLREAVDLVGAFRGHSRVECEVEKAADVVILVENAKRAFGFVARKSEIGQGERGSEAWGQLAVFIDNGKQGHVRRLR